MPSGAEAFGLYLGEILLGSTLCPKTLNPRPFVPISYPDPKEPRYLFKDLYKELIIRTA